MLKILSQQWCQAELKGPIPATACYIQTGLIMPLSFPAGDIFRTVGLIHTRFAGPIVPVIPYLPAGNWSSVYGDLNASIAWYFPEQLLESDTIYPVLLCIGR